jgi:hypothetical protein
MEEKMEKGREEEETWKIKRKTGERSKGNWK